MHSLRVTRTTRPAAPQVRTLIFPAARSFQCLADQAADNHFTGGYPHQYNNYEGFSFPTAAPWYEFPILSTYNVYTGGSPGADRIVFDTKGNFDSLITHTGASGNDFVGCKKA